MIKEEDEQRLPACVLQGRHGREPPPCPYRNLIFSASSDKPEPTEPLEWWREFRWSLQRKDPAWVVGEHRQLALWLACFVSIGRESPWRGESMASAAALLASSGDLSLLVFLLCFSPSVAIYDDLPRRMKWFHVRLPVLTALDPIKLQTRWRNRYQEFSWELQVGLNLWIKRERKWYVDGQLNGKITGLIYPLHKSETFSLETRIVAWPVLARSIGAKL